jgi:HD-GYP domain-containing protein (c-di-GMP phosphodiesterase class II)
VNLDQIRYYLNYILPDVIQEKVFYIISFLSDKLWWVFILSTIIFAVIILIIYKKMFNLYRERDKINKFLSEISSIDDIKDFEKKLIDFRLFFKAKYIAFYALKGETYVLQAHNIEPSEKRGTAGANFYLVKSLVKIKSTSGNFTVSTYVSEKNDFLLQIYSYKFINLKLFSGYIESIFALYRRMLKTDEITLKVKLSTITKEVQAILNKSMFSGTGYLQYILTLVKNAVAASGIKLFENGKHVLDIGKVDENLNKKRFYIHNTGFFVDIYTEKELSVEELKRVGSFLDMTGIFVSTFNETNNIAKYYVEFLVTANELFEAQNIYYKNHSQKVSIVSLEIGKTLLFTIEELKFLKLGALLHDIGMIADITNIIEKSSELSKDDLSLIKLHPLVGSILIEPVTYVFPISPIIKYHHERIDGSGYPFGLGGKEIPQMAQIVGLAEFFVGLISDRSYKKGMDMDKAKELLQQSGRKMFEQVVIDAFIDSFDSINQKFLKIDLELKRENS